MMIEGDLQTTPLPQVLFNLRAQAQTGMLTVQSEDDMVAISLLEGAIMSADSVYHPTEDILGELLEGRGLVQSEAFDAVLREHQDSGNESLPDLLVARGLVSREKLLEILRFQTYRQMLQLLAWTEGELKFYGSDEVSYEEGFQPVPVEELLIRSIGELGGRGTLKGPVPELEAAYRAVPPREPVKLLGRDGDGFSGGLWISSRQAELMQKLDGKSSAMTAAQALRLGRFEALYALYNLLQLDLVEHLGAVPTASAPAAPAAVRDTGPMQQQAPMPAPAVPGPAEGTFVPPDPTPVDAEGTDVEVPAVVPGAAIQKFVGPLLAAVLLIAIGASLFERPGSVLLPFPGQENQRETIERQLRYSLFLKIDRAARAFFLVNAHYPDNLQDLVDLGLLSSSDLQDPAGYELAYSAESLSYRIDLLDNDGQVIEGLGTSEIATGDFLLDPQILRPGGARETPLILID